jgi:serine/threonine-protein kinase
LQRLLLGGLEVALAVATVTLAQLVLADHTFLPLTELHLLVLIACQGLGTALVARLVYIASEPAVRRRWPHTLISWNRLLGGPFRDPLLGRDVLVGALAGLAVVLVLQIDLGSIALGQAPPIPSRRALGALSTPRLMAQAFFSSPVMGVFYSLGALFQLYLFQALVRRAWLARFMPCFAYVAPNLAAAEDPLEIAAIVAIFINVFILVRFGLLSSATLMFTFTVLGHVTLTLDWSVWYAGPSFAVLGFFAALLVAAFYTSLGGKPLFGRALLEE